MGYNLFKEDFDTGMALNGSLCFHNCAAGYLGSFCPKHADLVERLALSPFEAQVGGHSFAVSTGESQGS